MANKIILKKSSVAAKTPLATDLEVGELAVNLADQKLYTKNTGGAVIVVGSNSAAAVESVAGKTGVVTLTKSDVGLANVDDTSDLNKPVSTAQQTALNLKANLASPTFTGTPAAPTAAANTNTTQVATTAYVIGQGYLKTTTAASTYQPIDADLTAIAALAGTTGLLRKTAANTWSLDTASYLTANQTVTLSGDASGSGSTAIAVTLANSGVTAGTYTKLTVDAKGRATVGATLASTDIPSLDASKITTGVFDAARLPSYVDDVLEYANLAGFPVTGETGKIYVAIDTNKTYRWSGSAYVYITSGAVDSVGGFTGVVTATNLLDAIKTVDGTTSGLDADLLDGNHASAFYLATNPSGYITSSGSITGNAATASNASLLNSISAVNLFNNMGQAHGTSASFDAQGTALTRDFGYRYVQGSGNAPGFGNLGINQYYSWNIGLGSDYNYTQYGAQFAIPRNATTPYLSVRYEEGGVLGAWQKLSAGYADTAGSATSATTAGSCTGNAATATTASNSTNLGGYPPHQSAGAYNIVQRDGNGYIQNNYFYTSGGGSERNASGMSYFAGFNSGDYYIRSYTPAAVASAISGQTMNIAGSSTSCSGNATTATTSSLVSSPDGDRNAGTKLPNGNANRVRFDFSSASTAGTGGNYAGVMTYAPWDGTTASTGDASYQLAFGSTAANGGGIPKLNIRKGIDTTWNSWYEILHSGNYNNYSPTLTGGGASGSWGISVTGSSASCTGNAATATTATNQSGGTVSATTGSFSSFITVNDYVRVGNGLTASYIYMADTDNGERIIHNNSNQIGFLTQAGAWGAYCDDSGNWVAAGNVTAYSDERLKKNWRPVQDNFVSKLAKVKSGIYDRTDEEITQAGVSAQAWQKVLPETVIEDASGTLSVNYGAAAMVSCVELAKVIEELRAEIAEMKASLGK